MVLFQIPILGYTSVNGVNRITATVPCDFRGKLCRVSLLNYNMYFTSAARSALIRVDGTLTPTTPGTQVILPIFTIGSIILAQDRYEWDVYIPDSSIMIDIVEADQPPNSPVIFTGGGGFNFSQAYFSFDITPYEK